MLASSAVKYPDKMDLDIFKGDKGETSTKSETLRKGKMS